MAKKQAIRTRKNQNSMFLSKGRRAWCDLDDQGALDQYLNNVGCLEILSFEEERELLVLAQKGDIKARNQLIEKNLRMVIKIASNYLGNGLSFLDLIAEGNLGLLHAINKFDLKRSNKFITYASWWVREYIESSIMNCGKTVRVPVHLIKGVKKINREEACLEQILKKKPSMKELSEHMGQEFDEINKILSSKRIRFSDDYNEKEHTVAHGFMEERREDSLENHVSDEKFYNHLMNEIFDEVLNEKEKNVIAQRFGLFGSSFLTLDQAAMQNNLTREQIRRIQSTALIKIKWHLKEEGYDLKDVLG